MTIKGDDSEGISKKALDWLTGVSAIATILTTIFGLFGDNKKAQLWAFAAAIILAIISSSIYFYQRRRAAKLKIAESLKPLSATAALRGLLPFEEGDDLPGRGRDVQDIYTLVSSSTFRFGVLWGESGCGKTSLLRAGLVPKLRNENYLSLYIPRPTQNPQEAIALVLAKESGRSTLKNDKDLKSQLKAAALKRKKVVILFDQFEEFFLTNRTLTSRASFIKWLASIVNDEKLPIVFLIGIRGDFFAQLQSFAPQIPEPTSTRSTYQLQNFDTEQAKQIFNAAAKADGIPFESELIQAVIRELETEEFVRPAELQVVGTRLKRKNITRLSQYEILGGARGILSSYINEEIKQSANEQAARLILRLMCADAVETKSPTDLDIDDILRGMSGPGEDNQQISAVKQDEIQKILNQFVIARVLIKTEENKYNLAHDYLAPYVRTATEDVETSVKRANRLLKRYVAEYKEDPRTRIPFGRLYLIQQYASAEAKSGEKPQQLIKKSKRQFYVTLGGILAIPIILIVSLYVFLANSYYFSIENSYIVLRTGHPQLRFFPGFNEVVIQTDFLETDLDRQFREEIIRGEITGFWFKKTEEGYQLWGEQLAKRVDLNHRVQILHWLNQTNLVQQSLLEVITNAQSAVYDRSDAINEVGTLAQARPELVTTEMFQALAEIIASPQINDAGTEADQYLRHLSATALTELAQARPELVTAEMFQRLSDAFIVIINGQPSSADRGYYQIGYDGYYADALGQLARAKPEFVTPEMLQRLFESLNRNPWRGPDYDYEVSYSNANALLQLAQVRPEFVTREMFKRLFNFSIFDIDDQPDYAAQRKALDAFGQLAQARPEFVTSEMFQTLLAPSDDAPLAPRGYILGSLAQAKPNLVTSKMFSLLIDRLTQADDNLNVRFSMAYALGQLAQARPEFVTPEMFQQLITTLNDPDNNYGPDVRSATEYALGQLARARPEMFQQLITTLNDPDNDYSTEVWYTATDAFTQLAQVKPELVTAEMSQQLMDTLLSSLDSNVNIFYTADALTQLAQTQPAFITSEISQRLFDIISEQTVLYGYPSYDVQSVATYTLTRLAQARPELVTPNMFESLLNGIKEQSIDRYKISSTTDSFYFQDQPELISSKTFQFVTDKLTIRLQADYAPSPAADAVGKLAQLKPELVTAEMFKVTSNILIDPPLDPGIRCSAQDVFGYLAQARPELVTLDIVQTMIDHLNGQLANGELYIYTMSCFAMPPLTQLAQIKSQTAISEIIPALITVLKSDMDSIRRKTGSYALFEIAIGNPEYENIIRKQLQDLQASSQPHWRMAASQALEMIAIGDLAKDARSNPDQIDGIKLRLYYLIGYDDFINVFREQHIQFAAQTVLKEIEIIESESK